MTGHVENAEYLGDSPKRSRSTLFKLKKKKKESASCLPKQNSTFFKGRQQIPDSRQYRIMPGI